MTQNHSNGNTPSYIDALLAPNTKSGGSRRAWGIDVETVWKPFFTATNVEGKTDLPDDVLGAPIRLATTKDGDVKFNQSGRPVTRVHPKLNEQINQARQNFVAGLQDYTGSVQAERPEAYATHVARQQAAAAPIEEQEQQMVADAIQAQAEPDRPDTSPEPEVPTTGGRRNTSKPEPEMATATAS